MSGCCSPPLIPGSNSLFQDCQMFFIRHRLSPAAPRELPRHISRERERMQQLLATIPHSVVTGCHAERRSPGWASGVEAPLLPPGCLGSNRGVSTRTAKIWPCSLNMTGPLRSAISNPERNPQFRLRLVSMANDPLAGWPHPFDFALGRLSSAAVADRWEEGLSTYLPDPPRRREKRGTFVIELAPPSLANFVLCA